MPLALVNDGDIELAGAAARWRSAARLDPDGMASDAVAMAGPSLAHRIRIEAHAVWLAVRDRRTPWPARLLGLLVAAYALSPIDLIPDFVPVLGLVDDAVLIPLGVWLFARMVPAALLAEHRMAAERASERPVSLWGIALVAALWAATAWLVWSVAIAIYE